MKRTLLEDAEEVVERLTDPSHSLFEETAPELAGVHRASPLSVVAAAMGGIGAVAGLILLAIIRGFVDPEPGELTGLLLVAAALFGLSLVGALISWRTRTWELTDEGIVLRSGAITRKRLVVPYEHIHAINASSSLAERVLGLMTLDLDTGAAETEGDATNIKGMQAGLARKLQAELFQRKAAQVEISDGDDRVACATHVHDESTADSSRAASTEPLATFGLTRRQLLLAAVSESRVLVQAAAFVILLVQGLNFLQESRLVDLADAAENLVAFSLFTIAAAAIVLLVISLVVGFGASFVLELVRYTGFRVQRFADRITLERGLVDRVAHTVVPERIQYLRIEQGFVRQLLGYARVRAIVIAGPGGEDNASAGGGMVLHPFISLDDIEPFLAAITPSFAGVLDTADLRPLPAAAVRRQVFRTGVCVVTLAAALVAGGLALHGAFFAEGAFSHGAGAAIAAGVATIGIVVAVRLIAGAMFRMRTSRIGRTERHLVVVKGGMTREMSLVPRQNLQHASTATSPFQKRACVTTFTCMTAASDAFALRDVAAADTIELLDWLKPHA